MLGSVLDVIDADRFIRSRPGDEGPMLTSSIVRKMTESASSTEWMVTMCGWFNAATASASRRNRSRRSGSLVAAEGAKIVGYSGLWLGFIGNTAVAAAAAGLHGSLVAAAGRVFSAISRCSRR